MPDIPDREFHRLSILDRGIRSQPPPPLPPPPPRSFRSSILHSTSHWSTHRLISLSRAGITGDCIKGSRRARRERRLFPAAFLRPFCSRGALIGTSCSPFLRTYSDGCPFGERRFFAPNPRSLYANRRYLIAHTR